MAFEYTYAAGELVNLLAGVIAALPTSLLGIASYVLTGLALYTMAQNRGIKKPWLAWIPVVNVWLLGSLSDQYQYVVKGRRRSKRNWLLALNLLKNGAVAALIFYAVGMIGRALIGVLGHPADMFLSAAAFVSTAGIVSAVYAVLYFMALYDVYTSMDPDLGVLFLVLSILMPVTRPFFLFFCRNKESGMPPRRPVPPVAEPWEQNNEDSL